ncbi:hypothetical protein GGI11_007097, partial [Coemansia sp. RSA 2049]
MRGALTRGASSLQPVRYASVLAHSNHPFAQSSVHRQQNTQHQPSVVAAHKGRLQLAAASANSNSNINSNKSHRASTSSPSATAAAASSAAEGPALQRRSISSSSNNSSAVLSSAGVGNGRVWPIIFRHTGPMPPAPQAIDHLQFILGQKPLNMHVPSISPSYSSPSSPSFGSSSMEVRTAAEARRKATQQLENLQTIVQTASDILGALSKAAANRLQNQQQHLKPAKQQHIPVPANSSPGVPSSAVAAATAVQPNYNHRLPSEPANPKNSNASPASKPAVLFAMFLGGSGFGVY